jgi:hypothetical protein
MRNPIHTDPPQARLALTHTTPSPPHQIAPVPRRSADIDAVPAASRSGGGTLGNRPRARRPQSVPSDPEVKALPFIFVVGPNANRLEGIHVTADSNL